MPTLKPRIAVTLDPRVHNVIERLADLRGISRGSLVAELLTAVYEPMTRTVAFLEAAQDAPNHVKDNLRRIAEQAHDDLLRAAGPGAVAADRAMTREEQDEWDFGEPTPVSVTRGSGVSAEAPQRRLRDPKKRTGKGS